MENVLFKYLENRHLGRSVLNVGKRNAGPVITISRQTGCSAFDIAEILSKHIEREFGVKWKIVDKEILKRSAEALENNSVDVSRYFEGEKKSQLEEFLSSFQTKKFHSNIEIKNTITNVVQSIAHEGNVVIIGRGGVSIAHDISRSLHVRIYAPFEWRKENVIRRFNYSEKEAIKFIEDNDAKRIKLIETLTNKNMKCVESLFDIGYNRSKLLASEIANSIFNLAKELKVFMDI